jgi:hypothetical protein
MLLAGLRLGWFGFAFPSGNCPDGRTGEPRGSNCSPAFRKLKRGGETRPPDPDGKPKILRSQRLPWGKSFSDSLPSSSSGGEGSGSASSFSFCRGTGSNSGTRPAGPPSRFSSDHHPTPFHQPGFTPVKRQTQPAKQRHAQANCERVGFMYLPNKYQVSVLKVFLQIVGQIFLKISGRQSLPINPKVIQRQPRCRGAGFAAFSNSGFRTALCQKLPLPPGVLPAIPAARRDAGDPRKDT